VCRRRTRGTRWVRITHQGQETGLKRVLFHVQHLLGIGHLRRATILAEALVQRGFEVTIASGGIPVPGLEATCEVIQLPALQVRDVASFTLLDALGRRAGWRFRRRRRRALLALLKRLDPAVLVVEMFPFGRLKLATELVPLLYAAGRRGCLRVSSMRDIAVPKPHASGNRLMIRFAQRLFDRLLIHGDPRLGTLEQSLETAAALRDRLEYTGYVASPGTRAPAPVRDGGVVVSVGGGSVGGQVLRTALAARPLSRFAHRPMRLLCGPNLPASERAALRRMAPPEVLVEDHRSDLPALLARAEASVSQAGYNTSVELLASRVPAVLVPFSAAGESEQPLRARWLAARGLVQLVPENNLSPATLAAALDRAQPPPICPSGIDLGGAQRTAELLWDAVADPSVGRRIPCPRQDPASA